MTGYIVQDEDWLRTTCRSRKVGRLNERHYGAFYVGINSGLTRKLFGGIRLQLAAEFFRTSAITANPSPNPALPPLTSHDHPARRELLPMRVNGSLLPYWTAELAPAPFVRENQLIVAHGSTLRALVKFMEDISDAGINKVEIGKCPTDCLPPWMTANHSGVGLTFIKL